MVNIPPYGVVSDLLEDVEPDSVERYRMWLLLHVFPSGEEVVHKRVMERCLPEGVGDFVPIGDLLG